MHAPTSWPTACQSFPNRCRPVSKAASSAVVHRRGAAATTRSSGLPHTPDGCSASLLPLSGASISSEVRASVDHLLSSAACCTDTKDIMACPAGSTWQASAMLASWRTDRAPVPPSAQYGSPVELRELLHGRGAASAGRSAALAGRLALAAAAGAGQGECAALGSMRTFHSQQHAAAAAGQVCRRVAWPAKKYCLNAGCVGKRCQQRASRGDWLSLCVPSVLRCCFKMPSARGEQERGGREHQSPQRSRGTQPPSASVHRFAYMVTQASTLSGRRGGRRRSGEEAPRCACNWYGCTTQPGYHQDPCGRATLIALLS